MLGGGACVGMNVALCVNCGGVEACAGVNMALCANCGGACVGVNITLCADCGAWWLSVGDGACVVVNVAAMELAGCTAALIVRTHCSVQLKNSGMVRG